MCLSIVKSTPTAPSRAPIVRPRHTFRRVRRVRQPEQAVLLQLKSRRSDETTGVVVLWIKSKPVPSWQRRRDVTVLRIHRFLKTEEIGIALSNRRQGEAAPFRPCTITIFVGVVPDVEGHDRE